MSTQVAEIVELLDANKAKAAFFAPVIIAAGAAIASWIVTGNFDDSEIRTALGGAIGGAFSGIATWMTRSRRAEVRVLPGQTS